MGSRKTTDIKRVTFEDPAELKDSEAVIRAIYREKPQSESSKMDIRVKKNEDDIQEMKKSLSQILNILKGKDERSRSPIAFRKSSPAPSPDRKRLENSTCFACGNLGHFAASCPKRNFDRSRSPSPRVRNTDEKRPPEPDVKKDEDTHKIYEVTLYEKNSSSIRQKKSLILPIKIGSMTVNAVIDTAAQVSVLNRTVFDKMDPKPRLTDYVNLKGITKDSHMLARVAKDIPIKIGKTLSNWNMVIADIPDTVLLGIDFLEHNKVIIDLQKNSIQLNNEFLPLTFIKDEENTELKIYRIKLTEKAIVPPFSMRYVPIGSDSEPESDLVIHPQKDLKGLLAPHIVCNKTSPIALLRNPTERPIMLQKYHTFGTGVEVEEILDAALEVDSIKVNRLKTEEKQNALSRIPDETENCFNYKAGIDIDSLPCGGCKFCRRAQEQWKTFEEDIDYVTPLAVRRVNAIPDLPVWIGQIPREEIKQCQLQDPDTSLLLTWLQENYSPSRNELQLCSPAVKHFWQCQSQLRIQDVATKALHREFLGHLGQDKTLARLKKQVVWHHMREDCLLFIKTCKICSMNKKPNIRPKAELGQYLSGVPMGRVHMDLLGPLPVTKQKNKYVLMIVDQFTKWLECFPIPGQTAEIVAKAAVDGFISRFGCPLEVHTDQGKNVDGNLMWNLCELLEISKTRTTAYHPASNGQVHIPFTNPDPVSDSLTSEPDINLTHNLQDITLESDTLTPDQGHRPVIQNIDELLDHSTDLDHTFIYDVKENNTETATASRGRRRRQLPAYLADYVQDWELE
ncbi:unnamed protein product [Mytilus edulis]|uniref:Endonuclease n=1 Tax=Mytilus edulis TaxID=6550 RepID=A0A8S3QFP4_MYTED|nr:unnamed protein product [Mytilus edulis]